MKTPPATNDPRILALLASYERFKGEPLCSPEELWDAPFTVLSHGVEDPPRFWYGNRAALALFELTFDELSGMPSRDSAEPDVREERERLLADVRERGFSEGYSGVRVSKTGRRFVIEDVFVWNVLDARGTRIGQAATYRRHRDL